MKKIILTALACLMFAGLALAESKMPYDPILKASVIKKRIEVAGEFYVRAYLKPKNPNTNIKTVQLRIERNGTILKTMTPNLRTITEESLSKEYPWEILLPVGKKYSSGTELVHNLESGDLDITLSFNIEGKGLKVKKINND